MPAHRRVRASPAGCEPQFRLRVAVHAIGHELEPEVSVKYLRRCIDRFQGLVVADSTSAQLESSLRVRVIDEDVNLAPLRFAEEGICPQEAAPGVRLDAAHQYSESELG